MALVVFDLDGTISRHDTLLAYLTGFLRQHRARWLRMLLCVPALLGFVIGVFDRGQLKAALMKAALGGSTREVMDAWTAEYVTEFLSHGAFADALAAIAAHRDKGDTLVAKLPLQPYDDPRRTRGEQRISARKLKTG